MLKRAKQAELEKQALFEKAEFEQQYHKDLQGQIRRQRQKAKKVGTLPRDFLEQFERDRWADSPTQKDDENDISEPDS